MFFICVKLIHLITFTNNLDLNKQIMHTTRALIYELISAKDSLIDLRNILNKKITNIIDVIEEQGYDDKGNNIGHAKELNVIDVVSDTEVWANFPRLAKTDKQLLWLFENYFKKGVKFSEIQNEFNMFVGKKQRVDNIARRLKREGKLVVVKYNNSNKLSYWGLPSWINELNNDFTQINTPSKEKLPHDIYEKKVVRN